MDTKKSALKRLNLHRGKAGLDKQVNHMYSK